MSKQAKRDAEPIKLRIKLPLPMDVTSTVLKAVGLTYPRTMIGTPDSRDWADREMVLLIDQRDRHKSAKAAAKYEKIRDYASGWAGQTTELSADGIGMAPHEQLTLTWVAMARRMFELNPDAVNYLEGTAFDRETGQKYVFWCAKSEKQTPHELRQQAEARIVELEAEVAELRRQIGNADLF